MTNTTNTNQPRTSIVKTDEGSTIGVSTGGVRGHSGGTARLYVCNTCQGEVVWATSKRTGRKYLCNVRRSFSDGRFFQGNDLHNCSDTIAQRDAAKAAVDAANIDAAQKVLAKVAAWHQLVEMGALTAERAAELIDAEAHNIDHANAVLATIDNQG